MSCVTVWGGLARDERMAEAQGGWRQKLVSRTGQLESKGRAFIGCGSRERLRARGIQSRRDWMRFVNGWPVDTIKCFEAWDESDCLLSG